MDAYLVCFCLGASGLSLMAFGGLSTRHPGHDNDVGHVSLPGAGHGAIAALGHARVGGGASPAHGAAIVSTAHAPTALALRAGRGGAKSTLGRASGGGTVTSFLLAWLSPRVIFSVLVGFGATGLVARSLLAGGWLFGAALVGGLGFERLLVSPFWNFLMRFGSRPARTLDGALLEEARAVTHFDARGEGLIAIDLDGHFVQVLGTLRADQRGAGPRVRAGDRLLVEEVDAARNRCTVSRL